MITYSVVISYMMYVLGDVLEGKLLHLQRCGTTTDHTFKIYLEIALWSKCRSKKTWRIGMLLAADWRRK